MKNHLPPNRVIVSKGAQLQGFNFCEDAPNCEICYFLHRQGVCMTYPSWVENEVGYCSLVVSISPDNPFVVREHIQLYLEGILRLTSNRSLGVLSSIQVAIGFQLLTRGDWELGFYLKLNLFFKRQLPNEVIQELGLHFFINNLTDKDVSSEFGVLKGVDGYFFDQKSRESRSVLNSFDLPKSFLREYAFLVESGVQPLKITKNRMIKSNIFDWNLEYSQRALFAGD
jgi:hypothetical protein